jgi:hypothetical protein
MNKNNLEVQKGEEEEEEEEGKKNECSGKILFI